jgi:hypothetical protein
MAGLLQPRKSPPAFPQGTILWLTNIRPMCYYQYVDDKQFEAITALLQQIAENTKPPGRSQRSIEMIGLVVTIGGILAIVDQIIQWFWR